MNTFFIPYMHIPGPTNIETRKIYLKTTEKYTNRSQNYKKKYEIIRKQKKML